jgi:hypothetical protein
MPAAQVVLLTHVRPAMLSGALLGVVAGLVGYEILRHDRSWDDGRWARILLAAMLMLLIWDGS